LRITNRSGYTLHGFLEGDEDELIGVTKPITASVVILEFEQEYLFGFNINRRQWELPGGRIEPGETPRECAFRELAEESSQQIKDLEFAGLAYMQRPAGDFKYTALYVGHAEKLQTFVENNEWNKIKLRDLSDHDDEADLIHLELTKRICE